jgi:hypothetical protein
MDGRVLAPKEDPGPAEGRGYQGLHRLSEPRYGPSMLRRSGRRAGQWKPALDGLDDRSTPERCGLDNHVSMTMEA